MRGKFFTTATVFLVIAFACPASANTDASIQDETFFGIGGPLSNFAYNNESPGEWSVIPTYEYSYVGNPFTTNLIPGATNISVSFSSSSLLAPSTIYGVSSTPFDTMTISDGKNAIPVGGGTFLSSSFIETDSSGAISRWVIVALLGTGRSFVLGDTCCTIGDPPVMYTYNGDLSAPTATPLPAALPLFATGLAGLGWLARRKRKQAT